MIWNKRWIKRKRMIVLICILLFVLMGYLCFSSYGVYIINSEDYRAEAIDAMSQRMDSLFLEMNNFPENEGNDMLYLGKMRGLNNLINSEGIEWEKDRKILIDDFLIFMGANSIYYQLRYIDEKGVEIVKVERIGDDVYEVDGKDLQSKVDRYYFEETMKLDKEEIYISPLDLNIKNDVVENRGTKENPEYVPVIRYAMPVFDNSGKAKGILILNVYADYFLEDVRRLRGDGELSFLVDSDGYYLAHSNKSKEFSFMFGGKSGIVDDYPEEGRDILKGFDRRNLESENYIFSFRHVYPSVGMFEIYQGSRKLFGEKPEEEYYWVLVSVADRDIVEKKINGARSRFFVFVLFSILIILIILILLFIILVMNGNLK